ncbi:LTA synthase family protein [Stenotrophomonas sp. OVS01A]|uniref:LTA synthase family protein n=1 Tax=Stenotrophomonas sp. OVS01A TaxID=2862680 RepID=UPI001CBFCEC6|nr:LTA synthase family protein [Stenotrophomonas sp. OVS01A]
MKYRTEAAPAALAKELAGSWKILLLSVLACLLWGLCARLAQDFRYAPGGLIATALLLAPLLMALAPSLRGSRWTAAICLGLSCLLLLGNPIKVAMLHLPLSIADLQALPVLFKTMSGLRLVVGFGLVAAAAALVMLALKFNRRTLLSIALAICYVALLPTIVGRLNPVLDHVLAVAMEEREMPNGEILKVRPAQDPVAFLQARGPILYLIADWQSLHDENDAPSEAAVAAVPLQPWRPLERTHNRNIHIVLLESLWDTGQLAHHRTNRNPLDPRFLALWEQAGRPYALSPVLGGNTANAEFEVLCGFPAPRISVAFVNQLRNTSPCLPAVLSSMGYQTTASHAHEASNWNRNSAYSAAGFNHYRPITAFDLDDMDGSYLSDGSFFRQNLTYLSTLKPDAPVLNYQVSLSSHWAYGRDRQQRPDVVQVIPDDSPMLRDYSNAIAYTTQAFMDWAEEILARDPDAIIVAFGDHSPVLQGDRDGSDIYSQVNHLDTGQFDTTETRSLLGLSRTPLLIVDGERGAVRIGSDIPLYAVPRLISALLGSGQLLPQTSQLGKTTIRPFLGHLLTRADDAWRDCAPGAVQADSALCANARAQFKELRTLRQDTILGKRHFVQSMHAESLLASAQKTGLDIEKSQPSCDFEVEQWGPQDGILQQGFNVQDDGSSAVWISLRRLRGSPQLHVAGVTGTSTQGARLITAAFHDPQLMKQTTPLAVTLQCPGEPAVLVGHVTLTHEHENAVPLHTTTTLAEPVEQSCAFEVDQWGPQMGVAGDGFNIQDDGASAVWVSMKSLQGQPTIRVGGMTGESLNGASLITSSFRNRALYARKGKLMVSVQCEGQPEVVLGSITLAAPTH